MSTTNNIVGIEVFSGIYPITGLNTLNQQLPDLHALSSFVAQINIHY